MGRLERAIVRLGEAIDRIETVAGHMREREIALRSEAAETVGAALAELRRAAAEIDRARAEADSGSGDRADG